MLNTTPRHQAASAMPHQFDPLPSTKSNMINIDWASPNQIASMKYSPMTNNLNTNREQTIQEKQMNRQEIVRFNVEAAGQIPQEALRRQPPVRNADK